MRREQQDGVRTVFRRELCKGGLDILGNGLWTFIEHETLRERLWSGELMTAPQRTRDVYPTGQ